jgi:prepilin-type N-terminal cleavage/methylation domain-containing protein
VAEPNRLSQHPGFTVLEVLQVLLLLSILTAIAVPNWRALLPGYHLNSATRQMQSELHRTKARAVSGNVEYRLVFSKAGYVIERKTDTGWDAAGESRDLPAGIEVHGTTVKSLGFTARGTATPGTGGTVKLCNTQGQGKNVVVSSTGRIRTCSPNTCNASC